jgi:hypothetical protein
MGLKSNGDYGVKRVLKDRYPRAFKQFKTLKDVREGLKLERTQVTAALDGNVLLMQVPRSASSFGAYVSVVTNAIVSALGTAKLVFVVFDEPEHMTMAKREEQMRRDENRKKAVPLFSNDLTPYPTDDDYGVDELLRAEDCHSIVGCRPARNRFFDEVGVQVMARLRRTIEEWKRDGHEAIVLFDGLDARGASRPLGVERTPELFGSHPEYTELFKHAAVGEGDLKLAVVQDLVRRHCAEEVRPAVVADTKIHLTVTIDTDSICIELLERVRRLQDVPALDTSIHGVLCFRETNTKREMEDDPRATYCVLDYATLEQLLQQDMWGIGAQITLHQQRCAITLLCAGWILAGCDYTEIKGLNAAMVLDVLPGVARMDPSLMNAAAGAWKGDPTAVKKLARSLGRLVRICAASYGAQPGARKATIAKLESTDLLEVPLLRGAWTIAYWCGKELANVREFGFCLAV